MTALKLLRVGLLIMALYDDGVFNTRKSTITGAVQGLLPIRTDSVMVPTGWTTLPEKPFKGMGVSCS